MTFNHFGLIIDIYERTNVQTDTKRLRCDQTDANFINKNNERKERIERYNPDKSGFVEVLYENKF